MRVVVKNIYVGLMYIYKNSYSLLFLRKLNLGAIRVSRMSLKFCTIVRIVKVKITRLLFDDLRLEVSLSDEFAEERN